MPNPLQETFEEFKKAPPAGKVLAIAALVAVAGVGLYMSKHKTGSVNTSSGNALPVSVDTSGGAAGTPFPNFPANPPVSTGSTGASNLTPLLTQWPQGVKMAFGQVVTVNGQQYTIGPGSNGVIWGVPGTGWNLADWNRVPIGQGGKVIIYQNPQGAMHPILAGAGGGATVMGGYKVQRLHSFPMVLR